MLTDDSGSDKTGLRAPDGANTELGGEKFGKTSMHALSFAAGNSSTK